MQWASRITAAYYFTSSDKLCELRQQIPLRAYCLSNSCRNRAPASVLMFTLMQLIGEKVIGYVRKSFALLSLRAKRRARGYT